MSDPWKNSIDSKKISLETAKLFFSQTEKLLKSLNSANQQLVNKAYQLITILMPVTFSLVAYLITDDRGLRLNITVSILIFFLLPPLIFLVKIFFPKSEYFLGSQPKDIMFPQFAEVTTETDRQTIQILLSECNSYQTRITTGTELNKLDSKRLKIAVGWCCLTPILAVLLYFPFWHFLIYLASLTCSKAV